MTRPYNFAPGPATLPEAVLQQAAREMLDWKQTGTGVMEMSHRGADFMGIYAKTLADFRELLAIPENFKILFLQGGAKAHNAFIPMNLAAPSDAANFVLTGSGGIVEVQGTAEKEPFSEPQFIELMELAKKGVTELTRLQRLAIGQTSEKSG